MNQREIKFRVWSPSEKKMGMPFDPFHNPDGGLFDRDAIFIQFTGLNDKNGKEIFEGDIMQNPKNTRWFNWLIKIVDGSVCLINIGIDGYLYEPIILTKSSASEREIIGNELQHPELLKHQ